MHAARQAAAAFSASVFTTFSTEQYLCNEERERERERERIQIDLGLKRSQLHVGSFIILEMTTSEAN